MKNFAQLNLKWKHQPKNFKITPHKIEIDTEPNTDFWQKTYYGFQNDNAPVLYTQLNYDFTFSVKTAFNLRKLYDQSGVIIYQDSQNWCKISIEYENEKVFRLGSVVTNLGYSDWASTDIPSNIHEIFYRVSRRGQDFLVQYSFNDKLYHQMRIFHMHKPIQTANVGLYACSPLNSSHKALFFEFTVCQSTWKAHQPPKQ